MRRLKLSLILSAGLLSLGACASAPPDTTVCTELDLDRAFCIKTITGRAGYVDETRKLYEESTDTEYTWFEMRPYTVSVPYQDWKQLKKWIISTCKQTGKCDDAIASWERTILNMDAVIDAKKSFDPKGKAPQKAGPK